MIKVLAACGNGMGSSMIIKMKIEEVLKELAVDYEIDHCSVGEGINRAKDYSLIIISEAFVNDFKVDPSKTKVVGLRNLLSTEEIREKVKVALEEL
ncbi:PTS sugar transporter subunit IIB [Mollicutes bacterium LVI A0039]|nr:PTS sugar transporter subunit IIB [Mollicutes bacterium LVI A0039]